MNGKGKAEVVEALCLGCGSCLASCPTEALDLHAYTSDQLYAQIEAILLNKPEGEKRILVFADNNCTYRVADALGVRKMKYSTDTRIMRMPSSGRVTPNLIMYAFKKGADAVLIGDCELNNLPVPWTSKVGKENIEVAKQRLQEAGVKDDRIFFEEFNAGALQRFIDTVTNISEAIKGLQPITSEVKEGLCQRK